MTDRMPCDRCGLPIPVPPADCDYGETLCDECYDNMMEDIVEAKWFSQIEHGIDCLCTLCHQDKGD